MFSDSFMFGIKLKNVGKRLIKLIVQAQSYLLHVSIGIYARQLCAECLCSPKFYVETLISNVMTFGGETFGG